MAPRRSDRRHSAAKIGGNLVQFLRYSLGEPRRLPWSYPHFWRRGQWGHFADADLEAAQGSRRAMPLVSVLKNTVPKDREAAFRVVPREWTVHNRIERYDAVGDRGEVDIFNIDISSG